MLGPGSLFTSVLPNLLLSDMAKLLRDTKVPIVYIANLMTQPKETEGMNIVLRAVCMLLILLVGHAINIGLCTISSLVHPLRLIFVEYYKNAEFEGGGKEYRPFKKA